MPKMLETISLLKIFYDFRHKYKDDLPKTKTTQRHTKDRNSERRCQRHRFQRQRCQRQVGRFPDVVLISRALTWSLKIDPGLGYPRYRGPPLPVINLLNCWLSIGACSLTQRKGKTVATTARQTAGQKNIMMSLAGSRNSRFQLVYITLYYNTLITICPPNHQKSKKKLPGHIRDSRLAEPSCDRCKSWSQQFCY